MSTRTWGTVGARAIAPPRRFAPSPRQVAAASTKLAVWLTTAIVVATFLGACGVSRFAKLGSALTSMGSVAGLIATNFMLLMFLCAARIPAVDRYVGHDVAMRLHRRLGPWVFGLVMLHFLLVLSGGAVTAKSSLVAEMASTFAERDTALAYVAVFLLLAVIGTSWAIVRRRIPHEAWHVVHLATYGALILAIPHQFTSGSTMSQGAASWYWVGLISLTLIATLTYRIFVPLLTSWRQKMVVAGVEHISRDTMHIFIRANRLPDIDPEAGQWANWRFLQSGLWWHAHPFSLAGAPRGNMIRLTVKTVGDGTDRLRDVEPGTKVMIEGPYGRFTASAANTRNAVLIGAGSGMSAIRGILDDAHQFGRVTVIQRAGSPADVLYGREIRQICQHRRQSYFELVGPRGRGWMSAQYDAIRLNQLAPWVEHSDVYICGPSEWTDMVIDEALGSGVHPDNIHVERFTS